MVRGLGLGLWQSNYKGSTCRDASVQIKKINNSEVPNV